MLCSLSLFIQFRSPVSFPAAEAKYINRSNLRKTRFILVHNSGPLLVIVGKSKQQEGERYVVISQTCPEACPLGDSGTCQVDNHSSPSQASSSEFAGCCERGDSPVTVTCSRRQAQFYFVNTGSVCP